MHSALCSAAMRSPKTSGHISASASKTVAPGAIAQGELNRTGCIRETITPGVTGLLRSLARRASGAERAAARCHAINVNGGCVRAPRRVPQARPARISGNHVGGSVKLPMIVIRLFRHVGRDRPPRVQLGQKLSTSLAGVTCSASQPSPASPPASNMRAQSQHDEHDPRQRRTAQRLARVAGHIGAAATAGGGESRKCAVSAARHGGHGCARWRRAHDPLTPPRSRRYRQVPAVAGGVRFPEGGAEGTRAQIADAFALSPRRAPCPRVAILAGQGVVQQPAFPGREAALRPRRCRAPAQPDARQPCVPSPPARPPAPWSAMI
jgi:hypothetical protein